MKKLLLFFALCASLGAWAQEAHFGDATNGGTLSIDGTTDKTMVIAGHGNLAEVGPIYSNYTFTDKAVNAVFTLEGENYQTVSAYASAVGDYYLLSNYTLVPVEGQPVTVITSKDYFVKNGDVYTNAFNTVYDENKTYATVTAEKLEGDALAEKIVSGYVFTQQAVNSGTCHGVPEQTWYVAGEPVKVGELADPSEMYYVYGGQRTFDDLKGWDGYMESVTVFSSIDGIYTFNNSSYSAITSNTYKSNVDYYTVTFNDLSDNSAVASATQTATAISVPDGESYFKFDGNDFVPVNDGDILDPSVSYYKEGESYIQHEYDWYVNNGYMTATATPFWTYIKDMINENASIKSVVVKSEDKSNVAEIDRTVIRALLSTEITSLDLSEVYIETIKSPGPTGTANEDGTFMSADGWAGKNNPNLTITTLHTPLVSAGTELTDGTFSCLPNLKNVYLSDGIETLGANVFTNVATGNINMDLETVVFPNTLKTIKSNAFVQQLNIMTFVFPASIEKIETQAFGGTNPKDVYFLGVEAPIVERFAWSDNSYISNNALTDNSSIQVNGVSVNMDSGMATRANYNAQSGWFTMLHYPSTCTKAQAAKYTDVTRNYLKIDNCYAVVGGTVMQEPAFEGAIVEDEDGVRHNASNELIYYGNTSETITTAFYAPGKETEELHGEGKTAGNASPVFSNMYGYGNYTVNGDGNYSGGFDDFTVGSQISWPSINMAYRSTVVAQNDVLWDGVTTIGQGIRNAGDESYEGDGSEFEGLHQFVLAVADANPGRTDEWDMEKYCDGRWHTICLPFNITKGQMKDIFGAIGRDPETNELQYHIKLCKFDRVIRTSKNLQLCFNSEQFNTTDDDNAIVLKAHESYMIYAKKDNAVMGADFKATMKDYIVEPGAPLPTEIAAETSAEGASADEPSVAALGYYRFIGNYATYSNDPTDVDYIRIPQYSYFYSNPKSDTSKSGNFYFQTGTSEGPNKTSARWNPYTSVVYTPYGQGEEDLKTYFKSSAAESKIRTVILDEVEMDDEATAIETVTMEADGEIIYTNANIYNLNGQFVGNSIENLPVGIYVVNGKKYLVK